MMCWYNHLKRNTFCPAKGWKGSRGYYYARAAATCALRESGVLCQSVVVIIKYPLSCFWTVRRPCIFESPFPVSPHWLGTSLQTNTGERKHAIWVHVLRLVRGRVQSVQNQSARRHGETNASFWQSTSECVCTSDFCWNYVPNHFTGLEEMSRFSFYSHHSKLPHLKITGLGQGGRCKEFLAFCARLGPLFPLYSILEIYLQIIKPSTIKTILLYILIKSH